MDGGTKIWKDFLCSWSYRINFVKTGHLSKSNLQILCNLHQISDNILHRIGKKA